MQKKKNGVKKCLEISAIKGGGGGGGPLMAKAIKNFHFDYLTPSLTFLYNKDKLWSGHRGSIIDAIRLILVLPPLEGLWGCRFIAFFLAPC